MREAIQKYAEHDYTSYGCLIIFLMSHVDKSKIVSSDSACIDLNEFITPLKTNASLKSKPKIFFIQACRGSTEMSVDNDAKRSSSFPSSFFDHVNRLPKEVDFLFSYSTLEDHVLYRDEDNGTWYIQMLCKAIREEESKEISAILTYTHYLISQMVGTNRQKMTPTYENRLTKLHFYISKPPQVGVKCIKFIFFSSLTYFLFSLQRL